jgi:Arylsulfatase A and related enzymes
LNLFDTSVKVPCIFSMKGTVRSGVKSRALLSAYDFMPTLLDFLKIENPEADKLPGRSFLPVLLEGEEGKYREAVTVFDEYGPSRMIRTDKWKYIHRYPYGPHELYDLEHDPEERFNLLIENRFFNYGPRFIEDKAAEMKKALDAWFQRYVIPEIDASHEPVYGRGQLCKVGPESEGRLTFSPPSDVEYKR